MITTQNPQAICERTHVSTGIALQGPADRMPIGGGVTYLQVEPFGALCPE